MFDVGVSRDPARFSKSLKSIENFIQKTYKVPDDIVKAIQQMKQPTLQYPNKPTKDNTWTTKDFLTETYSIWQSSRGRKITRL